MVAPNTNSEQVRYDILIEAQAAIKAMRELLKFTDDNTTKIAVFTRQVLEDSKRWGVSWQEALNVYRQLNAELSKGHKATMFGQTGGQNLMQQSQDYLQALQDSGRMEKQTGDAAEEMGNKIVSAGSRGAYAMHFVRIALGALEAMFLFQLVQAVQNFFSGAIKNAQEFEASLYRIHNAERILSQEGREVSVKGLEDGIARIKKLLPIFSKEDITGLVGQVAITTKSLGLNEKQILDLAQAIAVMNVNSAENENLQQTAQKVMSSLLTDNAKGVANLGLKLGDAAIQAEAFRLGMLKAGESTKDLTEQEKGIVKVSLAIKNGNDSMAGMSEYLASNTAQIQKNKAAWNDLLTTVGQLIIPLIPPLTMLFNMANAGFNGLKVIIIALATVVSTFGNTLMLVLTGGIRNVKDLTDTLRSMGAEIKKILLNKFFPEGLPSNAPQWVKDFAKDAFTTPETPTGTSSGASSAEQKNQEGVAKAVEEGQQKIQDIMRESADKKADIEREYGDKLQDIAQNYSDKLADIAQNTADKREDALRDYNQKVDDINRDTNEKIAQAQQDARQKEIDREKQYQEKLRELREKFLFDLEDALRERDARQVLRLIRQYNMDKKSLEEKRKLDQQQSKKDLQQKIADLERERQLKLDAAKREYDDKLQQIAIGEQRALDEARIWHERQLRDANIWYQRQLQQQQEYLQRRLRDLAAALVNEYNLTAQGAASIYGLLQSYFGAGGLTSGLSSGINLSGLGGSTTSTTSGSGGGIGSGLYNPYDVRTQRTPYFGFAEGGTLLATKPTTVTFGEKGPEVANFTPLGRPGRNVGQIFGNPNSGQTGGDVRIRLELSPDLEARMVDSSLENLSVHLDKVYREK